MADDSPREGWYIWIIRPGVFDALKRFIDNNIPEVKQIVRPSVTENKVTKKGLSKKKETPLYAGYVFLNYYHDWDDPRVWIKLREHPLVTSYVGPCSVEEVLAVKEASKLN